MDFNTTYYTLDEYQKEFYKKLNSQKEYAWLTSKDLTLLSKNKEIKKSQYYHDKTISLNKSYANVLHAIKDTNFIRYMKKKDKTSKLFLVIHNQNKAILEYMGGDNICLWSNLYLLKLKNNILHIYTIDGFSGMYAPVKPL